jgi:uncharacterized lipoprotein YajG
MKHLISAVALALLVGCETSPKKPTTNTPAPSIDTSKEIGRTIHSNVADAKDGVRKARTIGDRIDNKINLLRDYK